MFKIRLACLAKIAVLTTLLMLGCEDSELDGLPSPGDIETFEFFDEPRSSVRALYEDEDENLWIGTGSNGALRFDGRRFTSFTTAEGMVSNTVYTILEDESEVVWFGTENGLNILENDQLFFFTLFEGVAVSSIIQDEDDIVWIGTIEFGILFFVNGEFFQILDNECISCNTINTIFEDSEGTIWFGTSGGLKAFDNNRFTLYTTFDGLSGNNITSIYEDRWGSYWIGTSDGAAITRFDGDDDFDEVSLLNSLPQNFITSTTEDQQGNLLIGTVAAGLVAYNGIVMSKIFEEELDDTILSLITAESGNVWIGTFDGTLVKYTGGKTL